MFMHAANSRTCSVSPGGRLTQVAPYTLHPTHYTLHTTHYTLHTTPSTLNPKPYTLHTTPDTLHRKPSTINPTPYQVLAGLVELLASSAGVGLLALRALRIIKVKAFRP